MFFHFLGKYTDRIKEKSANVLWKYVKILVPALIFIFGSLVNAQTVTQTFTASGSFPVPAGVTSITVECWGAGGGGGSAAVNNSGNAAGGGGGAYSSSVLTVVSGSSYPYVVGTGGSAGNNGGNSTFNTNFVVAAGGAGVAADANAGGAGGTVVASTGTVRYRGGNGGNATDAVSPNGISGGGGGGAGSSGNGGDASGATAGTGSSTNGGNGGAGRTGATENDGLLGSNYGGGGSGAHCTDNTNHTGGSGAPGLIIITYTRPTVTITSAVTNPTNTSPFTITITFSEAVSGFTTADLTLVNCTASAPGTSDNITFTSNITPSANGTVSVTVNAGSVTNAAGNTNLSASNTLSTVYDNIPPSAPVLNPLDNAADVGINANLVLTFGEDVKAGTAGNIIIYNSIGTVFESIPYNDAKITYSANTVTVNPAGTFSTNASYYVQISNTAITDMAGNFYAGINTTTAWNFTVPLPYFRSKAAGNWNATATWEVSPDNIAWSAAAYTPNDANSAGILIQSAFPVTVTGNVTADDVTVDGTLTINTGVTLTIGNGAASPDMTISGSGTLSNAGTITTTGTVSVNGTYIHAQDGGTIPLLTWNDGSTCSITGYTTNPPANLGQSFSNFTFNCNTRTLNLATTLTVRGNLTITAGTVAAGAQTIDLGGDLTGAGTLTYTSGILNIGGDNTQAGPFTCGTGTVNYNGSDQQVRGTTYYNLTVSNGGTKTMMGAVIVNNILNLNNGNLSLGSGAFNLTLINGATITTPGSFDNTHMIVCDGTGTVIKQSTTSGGFIMRYPVGTGTNYTPFEITGLTATVTGTGDVRVRAVAGTAPGPPTANATDLQKYWVVSSANLSAISANLNFTYINPDEVGTGGDQTTYILYLYAGGAWTKVAGAGGPGNNPMSVTGAGSLTGTWTGREGPATYYSYQSGDWATATSWTVDPSGTLSINPSVPGAGDRVVILNGRTIYTTTGYTVQSLQINEGGTLDIRNSTGHNFGTVAGQGLLRLQTSTFPGGTYTNFVAAGGGTIEYYNPNPAADIQLQQFTYNNLIINLDINARVIYTLGDMTINGNLTITRGNFRISDNVAAAARADLRIDILGNVTVSANGSFTVGTKRTNTNFLPAAFTNSNGNSAPFGSANDYPEEGTIAGSWVPRYYDIYHKVRIAGNFTNNGTVKFISSAITLPDFTGLTAESAATVIFTGNASTDLICNGVTDFYNLILDKGIDQTYELTVNASSNTNFRLFGRNDMGGGGDGGNPELRKALWIKNGTLRLTGSTSIATMAEGGTCTYSDGGPEF